MIVEDQSDLSLHSFGGQNFDKLVELSKTTYPGREISDYDYLKWEYIRNPDGEAIIHVAESGERIVSQYLVLPRDFSIGGSFVRGSLSANTLTHFAFRGKGLFPKLAKMTFDACREKDIHFTIGFPNQISHPVIRKEKLFDTIGHLPLLVRLFNPGRSIRKYFTSRKIKSGEEIQLKISSGNYSNRVSRLDFSGDKERYEAFLAKIVRDKQIMTYRSLKFMKWRYDEIPLRKYSVFLFGSSDTVEAMAVLRAKHIYGIRCGILVDFISHGDSSGALIDFLNKLSVENDLDMILTTVPLHSAEHSVLKKAGYFTMPQFLLPQPLAFIIKGHNHAGKYQLNDFSKWFLTFGDYDIF